jgi:hypothetical protein
METKCSRFIVARDAGRFADTVKAEKMIRTARKASMILICPMLAFFNF